MPEYVPLQVAEVTVFGELQGQACVNRWHLGTDVNHVDLDDWTLALIALAAAMLDCYIETLLPAVTSDYTLLRCEAKLVGPLVVDASVATANAGSVGQLGPTSVSFASLLVNLRTGRDGRKGRGKKFLPPPGEANITNSVADQPTMDQILLFLACVAGKFLGTGGSTEWVLGVISQKDRKAIGGNYLNSFRSIKEMNPVTALAVKSTRKKGSGS